MCRCFDDILWTLYYRSLCLGYCCCSLVQLQLLQTARSTSPQPRTHRIYVSQVPLFFVNKKFVVSDNLVEVWTIIGNLPVATIGSCSSVWHLCIAVRIFIIVCIPDSNRVMCPIFLVTNRSVDGLCDVTVTVYSWIFRKVSLCGMQYEYGHCTLYHVSLQPCLASQELEGFVGANFTDHGPLLALSRLAHVGRCSRCGKETL